MASTKQPKSKASEKKVGRPSKFSEHLVLAAEYMARAGMTDEQIAEKMGIHISTLCAWKKEYPEFSEAIKRGKDTPDDQVESALLKRALGFHNPDAVKIFMPAGADEPVYAKYSEYFPPDVMAIIYWLNNRRPRRWRKNPEESGDNGDNRLEVVISDRRKR